MHPQQPHQSGAYRQPYPNQQYANGHHANQQHASGQYANQHDHGDARASYGQRYAPLPATPKRRRVWPWVLLVVVLIPVLTVVGCSALFVGGVSAVQSQREGGTVPIGQTFTYKSGLALTVSDVSSYKSSNQFIVTKNESAYQGTVTVVNGTKDPVGAALLTINVTAGSTPAERIFEDAPLPTQDIAPGQQLQVPFQFKVKKGTTGPLQISVTAALNEPVFFTGTLK
jgi:hypothetical protein